MFALEIWIMKLRLWWQKSKLPELSKSSTQQKEADHGDGRQ